MISFRYREKETAIHRLNPLCKIVWVISIFIMALVIDNPLLLLMLFLSTLPVVASAKVWNEWTSFMKLAIFLCLAIIVINALVSYEGSHVIARASFKIPVMGIPTITLEAIFYGIAMSVRLLAIISAFSILTLTVNPDSIMLLMTKMKLPYKSVLVTSLSTRFVPTFIDDIERITDVQRTRGLQLDKGRLPQRIRRRMSIIIPLLSNSLDRSVQVAEAMEARAFGSGIKRTFYKEIKMSRIDIVTLIFVLALCALGISIMVMGYGSYQYYPVIEGLEFGAMEWILVPALPLLISSVILLAHLKRKIDLD